MLPKCLSRSTVGQAREALSLPHVPPNEVKLNKSKQGVPCRQASQTLSPQGHPECSSRRLARQPSQARAEKLLACSAKGCRSKHTLVGR